MPIIHSRTGKTSSQLPFRQTRASRVEGKYGVALSRSNYRYERFVRDRVQVVSEMSRQQVSPEEMMSVAKNVAKGHDIDGEIAQNG